MTKEQYHAYLKSPEWKSLARARLRMDGYACTMCGCRGTARNPLEIHHLNYKHVGCENVNTDILTLCHADHKAVHHMMERPTGYGRKGWKSEYYVPQLSVFTLAGEELDSVQGTDRWDK